MTSKLEAVLQRGCAIRWITATLVVLGTVRPAGAQVDSGPVKPLFTTDDAYLAGAFVIGTLALRPLDKRLAELLQDSSAQTNRVMSTSATIVRTIAEPGAFIIGVGMYGVGRLAHVQRAAQLGLHGTEGVVIGTIVADGLKGIFGRARPFVTAPKYDPDSWQFARGFQGGDYDSFPSGHTVAAFAAAAAVSSETSRWWPTTRWIIGPTMFGGATMVGLSRMYNNKHWASDVMMGAAIGTFAGLKIIRYVHSHPGNRVDKFFLGGSIGRYDDGTGKQRFRCSYGLLPP